MNLLNFALGGLEGGLTNSPLTPLVGIGGALLAGGALPGFSSGAGSAGGNRDSLVSALPDILSAVNSLSQAAGSASSGGGDMSGSLQLPSLPQMPAPAQSAPAPTDDNGQSNVVLQDSDADSAFIS